VWSSAQPGYCVQIRGSELRTFMDWQYPPLPRWSIGRTGHATIDGRPMWEATTRCVLALFDRHVREVHAASYEGLAAKIPELTVAAPRALFKPAN
jgi:hypothetical protein